MAGNTYGKTVDTITNKQELMAIPVEVTLNTFTANTVKSEELINSNIKEEVEANAEHTTFESKAAIDIKIKEETKNDTKEYNSIQTGKCSPEHAAEPINIAEMVQVKIEVKEEELHANVANIKRARKVKTGKRLAEYQCQICSIRVFGKDTLAEHKELEHTLVIEPVVIETPPISSFQDSFEQHIKRHRRSPKHTKPSKRTHLPKPTFKCNLCDYTCLRKPDLDEHYFKHNRGAELKPNVKEEKFGDFKCSECSYETLTASFFKEHIKLHKEPVQWIECPYCPYKTSYKHGLRYHARLHEDQDPLDMDADCD